MNLNNVPPLLTVAETVKTFRLPERYLRDRLRAGTIPSLRIGTKYLINSQLLAELIDKESRREANGAK